MGQNVISEIRSQYDFLTKVEKSIADLILLEPKAFIKRSMAEISYELKISQGSVNNFAKKFCPEGFSALKLQIAACPAEKLPVPFSIITPENSAKSAMRLKIEENIAAYENTLRANSEEVLLGTVEYILGARRVDVYGVYHSGIVAKDLSFQLMRLGIAANFVEDTLMCSVSATMLDEKDLVIAITSSGRTKEIIDAAKIAKENGTPIIAVTSNKFSPLAQLSDITLITASSGMSLSDRTDEIRHSQLFVLDTVCAMLRTRIDAGSRENYYKLSSILNSHSIDD